MADIFISYAREDRSRIEPLAKAFEELGWSVWWDWTIPVGKTWRQVISEELEAAACVVVAWSNDSIKSEWVMEEADEGRAKNILAPALIADVRPPMGFRQIQAANLVNWQGEPDDPEFVKLLHAVESILGPPKRKEKVQPAVPPKAPPRKTAVSQSTIQPSPESVLTNKIGMKLVLMSAGAFKMGNPKSPKELMDRFGGEEKWYKREKPHHTVKIERPFYLQTTPVTQGQWQRVMGNNPSNFKSCGNDCPVEEVSWEDAQRFIEKLNKLEKTEAYRLPSEAEWEYACRAGSDAEFSFGDDAEQLGEFAWLADNSGGKTHPVGEKKPNAWGLFDMHGNVREWVEDDWHDNYKGAPTDGSAWIDNPRGSMRVLRIGSLNSNAQLCRSATRGHFWPGRWGAHASFRLSKSVALGP
jgi:formylglycine-generating enzyme required for sulfatase activity